MPQLSVSPRWLNDCTSNRLSEDMGSIRQELRFFLCLCALDLTLDHVVEEEVCILGVPL